MTTVKMVKLGTLIKPAKLQKCGNDDYPVLSMTMHNGLVFQSDKFKKSVASQDKSTYKVVHRNQLVIGFPIDEGVLATQRITDAGIVSPAYGIWDVDQTKIIPEFLEYALRCNRAIDYYKAKLRGSTARRRSLPTPTLLELDVPLPDIEQQKLALTTIHHAKNALDSRQAQLTKLDELVKARFVEMFGDPIQNEKCWETKSLFDLGYCKNGMNFHKGDHGVEIHCLGVGDFKDRSTIHEVENLPFVALNESPDPDYLLQDGDIVFVRSNGNKELVGRCLAIYPANVPVTYSGFCIRYRLTSEEASVAYLLRVLKADSVRKKMAGRGANIQNLNQQTLSQLAIPLPPLSLQNQFAAFVAEVDKSKVEVQKALDQTQLLFDSLMQQYFG